MQSSRPRSRLDPSGIQRRRLDNTDVNVASGPSCPIIPLLATLLTLVGVSACGAPPPLSVEDHASVRQFQRQWRAANLCGHVHRAGRLECGVRRSAATACDFVAWPRPSPRRRGVRYSGRLVRAGLRFSVCLRRGRRVATAEPPSRQHGSNYQQMRPEGIRRQLPIDCSLTDGADELRSTLQAPPFLASWLSDQARLRDRCSRWDAPRQASQRWSVPSRCGRRGWPRSYSIQLALNQNET